MAAPRRKKAADQEIVSSIAEQVSGEDRSRHEREPLGFEDKLPTLPAAEMPPEQDPQFRPMLDLSVGGMPTHENYDLDAPTHFRRRRNAIVGAMVLTVFVAGAWLWQIRGQIVPSNADAGESAAAISEARARFGEQFGRIAQDLTRIGAANATNATPPSLQAAVAALGAQLTAAAPAASSTASTTPR